MIIMKKRLDEIAALIDGEIVGNADIDIVNVNGIREAQEGEITFLANPLYRPMLKDTKASAVITSRDIESAPRTIIRTDDPSLAFSKVLSLFMEHEDIRP